MIRSNPPTMELMLKDYSTEVDIGASTASFHTAMESQKQVFHSQIDQLRNIVVTQCKLTGVNPLSQEMAAGALSIKIGKRPRDLLNPKALKYMQAVFAIKDAISKKESREIGALFGLTVTQVREYFASQRTRVRKMVQLSREKAIRASAEKEMGNIVSADAEKELGDSVTADADPMLADPVPLNTIAPSSAEEAPSCLKEEEALPGLGESDKRFVENILSSMYKEESFSGQVKLMEWILQIDNPSVLSWFLSKDGVLVLATWLTQAANEEQTSVLSTAMKVLCHLPLNKALPAHMAAILQGVNRLRFFRVPDISNRARVLLSKWSKMFAKSQALKKPNGVRTAGGPQQEIDLSQRIGELMGDDSWQTSIDNPDGILVPSYPAPDDIRKFETQEDIKLLTASSDDSNRKNILGACSTHNKERRKVLLVEQPGQKTSSKGQQLKSVSASQARPITADEIQKAKMRAQYMQPNKSKTEGSKRPSLFTNDLLSASEAYLRPKLEAQKKARVLPPKISKHKESLSNQMPKSEPSIQMPNSEPSIQMPNSEPSIQMPNSEPSIQMPKSDPSIQMPNSDPSIQMPKSDSSIQIPKLDTSIQMPIFDQKESLLDRCRRVQIPWRAPPDVQLSAAWGVGTGENSKEVEAQKNRMRREREIIYRTSQDIPPNPKDPWDFEMDYDDTLTPQIPIDQLPDADGSDAPLDTHIPENHNTSAVSQMPASTSSQAAAGAEPDLELLAVLLKNPELVFALTSGQTSGLSSEDTIKLLDVLKSSGGAALLNGQAPKIEEKRVEVSLPSPTPTPTRNVEVSLPSPTPPSRTEVNLPSPTPSSNTGPIGWTSQAGKNPFSRQTVAGVATAVTSSDWPQNTFTVQSQFPSVPGVVQLPQQFPSQTPMAVQHSSPFIPEAQQTPYIHAPTQIPPTNYDQVNRSMSSSAVPGNLHRNDIMYLQSQMHPQQAQIPEYQISGDSNMGMVKSRHHGLAHNSFPSNPSSQNVYNPTMRGASPTMPSGPQWERNEVYSGGHKGGYESWSPENSPARYPPLENHHGHAWSHPEQRGYAQGPPPDRLSRNQNSPGFQDRNWQGGGVNRRWHDDRRR